MKPTDVLPTLQQTPVTNHPQFTAKLIETLTAQRNGALTALAEAEATISVLASENEFLSRRMAGLEQELERLRAGVPAAAGRVDGNETAQTQDERQKSP